MKSVGEVMAIGRTFKEALNKTLRSLENGWSGFHARDNAAITRINRPTLMDDLRSGTPERILKIWHALTTGMTPQEISELTGIDVWFLENLRQLVEFETVLAREYAERSTLRAETLRAAKRMGFADKQIGMLTGKSEKEIRSMRKAAGVIPSYKIVDTCAAEFEAFTPYFYSTYEDEDEAAPTPTGEGHHPGRRAEPHRPGHRVRLLLRARRPGRCGRCGYRSHHDQLQPRDREHGLRHLGQALLRAADARGRAERDRRGKTRRGDRPVRRSDAAQAGAGRSTSAGVTIWGTSPDSIDLAEDRDRFGELLD